MEVIAEEEIDLIWCWMDSTATNMKATYEWTTGRLLLCNLMCNPLYSSSSPKRTTTQNGFILFRNIALLCTACFSPMGYIHRGRSSLVFLLFHVHSLYCFGISFTMRIPRQRALREESLSFPTNTQPRKLFHKRLHRQSFLLQPQEPASPPSPNRRPFPALPPDRSSAAASRSTHHCKTAYPRPGPLAVLASHRPSCRCRCERAGPEAG